MRIENVGNNNYQMNVPNKAARADTVQQFSASEIKEKMLEKDSELVKEAPQLLGFRQIWTLMPEGFTDEDAQDIASLVSEGKTVSDWTQMLEQSGRLRKIPQVVYDIQAKNPYDETYYSIYITDENDNKIRCRRCDEAGTIVWELDISDEDRGKINDYFKQFKPCPWDKIAYFDNDNGMRMGRTALKEFWLELLGKSGNNNYQMNVPNKAARADTVQQFSASEIKEKMLKKGSELVKEAPQLLGFWHIWTLMPEGFTDEDAQDIASLVSEGKNSRDWLEMMYQSGRIHKIPEVVYDIQAKNPYDETYYSIYITDENDNKIRCRRCDEAGTIVWEFDICDEDRGKINDYFKQFKPCPWDKIAYFDNDNGMRMGRTALKEFWLELLGK